MKIRFVMKEIMRGVHHFVDPALGSAEEADLYFRIKWGQKLLPYLNPVSGTFFKANAHGVIFVEGLTEGEVDCSGTLELRYLAEQKLRYTLDFVVDGEPYRYVGEKRDVKLWEPIFLIKTHTTCYGRITDSTGRIISRSVIHFGMGPKSLLAFSTSFRVLLW